MKDYNVKNFESSLLNEITGKVNANLEAFSDYGTQYDKAIIDAVSTVLGPKGYGIKEKNLARQKIDARIRGYHILQPLIEDFTVSDILVNSYKRIYYEQNGTMKEYPAHFESRQDLVNFIHRLLDSEGKAISEKNPITDLTFKDGIRANIVLNPIAQEGPVLSIRKFTGVKPNMQFLLKEGFLNKKTYDLLFHAVKEGKNIFVSGGTGSGKTTFLNALSTFIPKEDRVILIEDCPELQFKEVENKICLLTREEFADKSGAIGMSDLIRTALRMRPDRIIVGEIRGPEAADMLWAMNTGHRGSLSTGHANSAKDMLSRICLMAGLSQNLSADHINKQIASALDLVIHLDRKQSGHRKIVEIISIKGFEKGEFILEKIL